MAADRVGGAGAGEAEQKLLLLFWTEAEQGFLRLQPTAAHAVEEACKTLLHHLDRRRNIGEEGEFAASFAVEALDDPAELPAIVDDGQRTAFHAAGQTTEEHGGNGTGGQLPVDRQIVVGLVGGNSDAVRGLLDGGPDDLLLGEGVAVERHDGEKIVLLSHSCGECREGGGVEVEVVAQKDEFTPHGASCADNHAADAVLLGDEAVLCELCERPPQCGLAHAIFVGECLFRRENGSRRQAADALLQLSEKGMEDRFSRHMRHSLHLFLR